MYNFTSTWNWKVNKQTVNVDRYIEDLNSLYKELGNEK